MNKLTSSFRSLCEHVLAAQMAWEEAKGTITQKVLYHRNRADIHASDLGCRLEWHSIHPSIHWPNGTEQTWADFIQKSEWHSLKNV